MNRFRQIAQGLNVRPALAELDARPDLWRIFTARQDAPCSAHRDTECVVLRGPAAITVNAMFNGLEADWLAYAYGLPALRALLATAVVELGEVEQLGRVMAVNLKPGGRIDPHVDEGAYAAHYERFHLVLRSAPGNWFYCGDETVHMQEGELWKFDHRTEHQVANLSDRGRIHLIIDARLSGKGN